jgi:PIN domain nuclease of toxin-antitoxin system
MGSVVADTHAVIWYLLEPHRLPAKALEAIEGALSEGSPVLVSCISGVEAVYLVEKGKLSQAGYDTVAGALSDETGGLQWVPVDRDVVEAMWRVPRSVVSDLPDRIIAATAIHLELPLVTRDSDIKRLGIPTIWD